uniref:Putative ovule protein n=1 Tax=Solanum chacoense TaxID=4108 RepID=A0A0V0GQG0_SOLCH
MPCESRLTSTSASGVTSLNLHSKYSILVVLNLETFSLQALFPNTNLASTPPQVSSSALSHL